MRNRWLCKRRMRAGADGAAECACARERAASRSVLVGARCMLAELRSGGNLADLTGNSEDAALRAGDLRAGIGRRGDAFKTARSMALRHAGDRVLAPSVSCDDEIIGQSVLRP